jgi:hypothetical protein
MNPVYTMDGFRILFDQAGQSYGSTPGRQDEVIDWIGSRVNLPEGSSICDIGCYDGGLLRRVPAGVHRIGVDIDEPAIARARESDPAGNYVLGDLHDFTLPYAPTAYVMFHVLEHVERPVTLLSNLRTQSDSATRLVLEVPILELVRTEDVCGFFSVQHLTHFTRRTLRTVVEKAGWTIDEWHEQTEYNGCRLICSPSELGSDDEATISQLGDIALLHAVIGSWHTHIANQG